MNINETNNEILEGTNGKVYIEEIKGYKRFRRFFTIILVISIVNAIVGIISCTTKGSVEVWQHVILWLSLIIYDATFLIILRSIKNMSVEIEEKGNE